MKINLISDTFTIPSAGMLDAMMHAKVGDDVFKEDPTLNDLEKKVATMFGMESGLFFPSGTMKSLKLARTSDIFRSVRFPSTSASK